jgi:hypothetical protein
MPNDYQSQSPSVNTDALGELACTLSRGLERATRGVGAAYASKPALRRTRHAGGRVISKTVLQAAPAPLSHPSATVAARRAFFRRLGRCTSVRLPVPLSSMCASPGGTEAWSPCSSPSLSGRMPTCSVAKRPTNSHPGVICHTFIASTGFRRRRLPLRVNHAARLIEGDAPAARIHTTEHRGIGNCPDEHAFAFACGCRTSSCVRLIVVRFSNGAVEGPARFGVTGRLVAVPSRRLATVVVVAYNGRYLCDGLACFRQCRSCLKVAAGRTAAIAGTTLLRSVGSGSPVDRAGRARVRSHGPSRTHHAGRSAVGWRALRRGR